MRAAPFVLLLLLAGCATQPVVPATAVAQPAATPAPLPSIAQPVLTLAKRYRHAAAVADQVVTSPAVNPDDIEKVRVRYLAARNAMTVLARQKQSPTREALHRAQARVHALDVVLSNAGD